jgi:hypothetical protein
MHDDVMVLMKGGGPVVAVYPASLVMVGSSGLTVTVVGSIVTVVVVVESRRTTALACTGLAVLRVARGSKHAPRLSPRLRIRVIVNGSVLLMIMCWVLGESVESTAHAKRMVFKNTSNMGCYIYIYIGRRRALTRETKVPDYAYPELPALLAA